MEKKTRHSFFEIAVFLITVLFLFSSYISATNYSHQITLIASTVLIGLLIFLARPRLTICKGLLFWLIAVAFIWIRSTQFSNSLLMYNATFTLLVAFLVIGKEGGSAKTVIKALFLFSIMDLLFIIMEAIFGTRIEGVLRMILDHTYFKIEMRNVVEGVSFAGLSVSNNIVTYSCVACFSYGLYVYHRRVGGKYHLLVKILLLLIPVITVLFLQRERSNLLFIPLVYVLVFLISDRKRRKSRWLYALLVLSGGLFLFWVFIPYLEKIPSISKAIGTIDLFMNGNNALEGRAILYSRAIEMWKSKPFLGNGWFCFYHSNNGIIMNNVYSHAHNLVLELLADVGIIGTIIVLIPILYTFVDNVKLLKKTDKNNQTQYADLLRFTLSFQLFLILDSLLHVSFYNYYILILYLIVCFVYYAIRKELTINAEQN